MARLTDSANRRNESVFHREGRKRPYEFFFYLKAPRLRPSIQLQLNTMQDDITISIPGDLIYPGARVDEFTSMIGGRPTFPAEAGSPSPEALTCRVCSDTLSPVLSVRRRCALIITS